MIDDKSILLKKFGSKVAGGGFQVEKPRALSLRCNGFKGCGLTPLLHKPRTKNIFKNGKDIIVYKKFAFCA